MNKVKISEKKSKTLIVGLILSTIFLIGTYASLFIPAIIGTSPKPISGYVSVFWNAIFFTMLWEFLHKKKRFGFIIGVIVGLFIFFCSAFIADFQNDEPIRVSQPIDISEWSQTELAEAYMSGISKNMCMLKTIESLKKCDSESCIRTMAGITGDCVSYAHGSMDDFCSNYKSNYISKYCDSGVLNKNASDFIRSAKIFFCKKTKDSSDIKNGEF